MIYEHASLRQGLVGAWCPSLGASGYLLRDRSDSRRDASLINMGGQVAWQAGIGGISLALDGSNDYAQTGSLPIQVAGFPITLSAWARPNNITQTTVICVVGADSPNGSRRMILQRNALLESNGQFSDVVSSSNVFSANTWTHVAITCNTSSMNDVRLYANGLQVASTISWSNAFVNLSSTRMTIGATESGAAPYNGRIDDVRVYSRALTPAEIRLLASRRGIGLVPQRQRRVPAPTILNLNVGGTWEQATPWVNVGGTWRQAYAYTRQGGVWK